MADSVILNSPFLLVGFGIALFFCLTDLASRKTGYVFQVISAVTCVIASIAALLLGASLFELCTGILVFLALNLTVYYTGDGGDDK